MDKSLKNIIYASALSSSKFIQSICESGDFEFTDDISELKFETNITILDKDNVPILVSRATAYNNDAKSESADEDVEELIRKRIASSKKLSAEETADTTPHLHTHVETPVAAVAPVTPIAPVSPVVPTVPATPVAPQVVQTPVAPVVPVAPVAPVAPTVPVAQTETAQYAAPQVQQTVPAQHGTAPETDVDKKVKIESLLKKYSNI